MSEFPRFFGKNKKKKKTNKQTNKTKQSKTKTKNKQIIIQFDETLMLLNQVSFVEHTKFCYKRDQHYHCKNPQSFKLPSWRYHTLKSIDFREYRFCSINQNKYIRYEK